MFNSGINSVKKIIAIHSVQLIFRIQTPVNTNTNVKVLSNGTVFWTTPIDVSVTCNYHFRDNLWNCPLHFGSWSYTGATLFRPLRPQFPLFDELHFTSRNFQKKIKVKIELGPKTYNVFVHRSVQFISTDDMPKQLLSKFQI